MIIAILPLIVAIIGLLMYAIPSNAKVEKIGFVMFWTGTLVTLMSQVSHVVKIG